MITEFIKTYLKAPLFKRLTQTVTHTAPCSLLVRGVKQAQFALLLCTFLVLGTKKFPHKLNI